MYTLYDNERYGHWKRALENTSSIKIGLDSLTGSFVLYNIVFLCIARFRHKNSWCGKEQKSNVMTFAQTNNQEEIVVDCISFYYDLCIIINNIDNNGASTS